MQQEQHEIVAERTLRALSLESVCLQVLVEAGYGLDEAADWLDAWAGSDARALWEDLRRADDLRLG